MSAALMAVSVYDGQRLLGHIYEKGDGKHIATTADGIKLGVFKTRKGAADAISAADSPAAGPQPDVDGEGL